MIIFHEPTQLAPRYTITYLLRSVTDSLYNLGKCHITAVDARRSQFLDLSVTQCVMSRQIFCFSQFSSPLEISAEINEELVYIVHHIVGDGGGGGGGHLGGP